mgnify:FL=1
MSRVSLIVRANYNYNRPVDGVYPQIGAADWPSRTITTAAPRTLEEEYLQVLHGQ